MAIEGGPGWHIDGEGLLPVLDDAERFRAEHADDPAVDALELLWSGRAAEAEVDLRTGADADPTLVASSHAAATRAPLLAQATGEDAPVRLLLLADTHVPVRARDLPDEVWAQVESADLVLHAGDWVAPALLDHLQDRSAALLACWGNNDGPELRERLPEVAHAVVAGVRVGVVHETGPRAGRESRMRAAYPDLDLLVFGHSHIPWDSETDGLRLLNPGSPTDRRRQPFCTYLTATLNAGRIEAVVLHRLPPRAGQPPGRRPVR